MKTVGGLTRTKSDKTCRTDKPKTISLFMGDNKLAFFHTQYPLEGRLFTWGQCRWHTLSNAISDQIFGREKKLTSLITV